MTFFSNPWVVAICSSVIGGVVVARIMRAVVPQKDNPVIEETPPKAACVVWNYPSKRLTDRFRISNNRDIKR